jgi:ubiquinone/menaquinone biosynthesis C-methylase UbiE
VLCGLASFHDGTRAFRHVVIAVDTTNYFVKNHSDLDGWTSYDISLDQYSQSLVDLLDLKKDDLVLDDGCGNGRFSMAMALGGTRVVALDVNKFILKAATKWSRQMKLSNCLDLVLGDIQNLPFKEGIFDRLLCAHNLWYVSNYQVAVSEMFRTLKSGGKVVVDHLNILNRRILLANCLYVLRKVLKRNPTPVFFRTPKEILQPFGAFIIRVYSLSNSNKTTVDIGSKALTPRLIISGSKQGNPHVTP